MLLRLLQNQLFVKAEKCEFPFHSVLLLCLIVASGQVQMDKAKVEAVLNWPVLETCKHVQHFLEFVNFYRRFIKEHS